MKPEKLSDAIGMIDDDIIEEADKMRNEKKKSRKLLWIALGSVAACAAIAAVVLLTMNRGGLPTSEDHTSPSRTDICDGYTHGKNNTQDPTESTEFEKMTLAKVDYPDLREPLYEDYANYEEYDKDWTAYREVLKKFEQNTVYAEDIPDSFFADTMQTFLSGHEGENIAFSPVNAYMALAMVAETADGNSRQQILDVLGAESIEQLRNCANGLWKCCYQNSALNETLLANSMWLGEDVTYNTETLQSLVDNYYASAFSGKMGSEEYNKLLQAWLNENTGGLLEDEAANVEFDAATVFGLASTVYYKAQWLDEFNESRNTDGIFTTTDGEKQQAEFMNFSDDMYSYRKGEGYIATYLNIESSDDMWLILPDEGTTPEQLIENGALNEFLYGGVKDNSLSCEIHFSMPKFDITSQCDLIEGMRELGITDVFESGKADFSPLLDNDGVFINKADNAVRVAVDEKGVSAASFIVMDYCGAAMPQEYPVIDFKLDRPFIFLIENNDDMVLFCGIVNSLS